jgi:hypothetical protein
MFLSGKISEGVQMKWKLLLSFLVCGALACSAYADTLTLKNGQVIYGVFISKHAEGIQFIGPDGSPKTYPFQDVKTLTFGPMPSANPAPPAPAPATPFEITAPVGTVLLVRMNNTLDSSTAQTGQIFTATLSTNLEAQGYVVAKMGTTVYGQVVEAQSAGRATGRSQLKLQLTQIVIGGNPIGISTSVYDTEGKSSGRRSLRRLFGGAGLGAAIGAIAGNAGMGAAIGAVSGAALAVVQKGNQVQIPSEAQLEFTLEQPVTLPVVN